VAKKIGEYNLLAVPVVENDGSVVGFVTVDDVIDVLIEEGTEDILRLAAVEGGALDKPYFHNPILGVVRKRIGCLLLLFVAESFAASLSVKFVCGMPGVCWAGR
jgi:magnesium transporter